MASAAEVIAFDETDPYLLVKRILPDGRCLRLSLIFGGLSLTVAEDEGSDFFDLRYDYSAAPSWAQAFDTANTWDGTGEPVGYTRRCPPLPELLEIDENEETWPDGWAKRKAKADEKTS